MDLAMLRQSPRAHLLSTHRASSHHSMRSTTLHPFSGQRRHPNQDPLDLAFRHPFSGQPAHAKRSKHTMRVHCHPRILRIMQVQIHHHLQKRAGAHRPREVHASARAAAQALNFATRSASRSVAFPAAVTRTGSFRAATPSAIFSSAPVHSDTFSA